jgi:hypothetical protein
LDMEFSMVVYKPCSDLVDMHRLTLKIEEVTEFQRGLSIK